MKRFLSLVAALMVVGATVFAHGTNEHVRGVVTKVSDQSITVQLPDKAVKTLAITAKTTYQQGGKRARLSDVKVGARVVIDVPLKTTTAALIQIGGTTTATSQKE
jgi:exoribonuclease R